MKTYQAKKEELEYQWYLVNAEGKALGRLATELAKILKGKNKPTYTPHLDTGDFVIVVNAGKVTLTGRKMKDKIYYHHTGYPGGIKEMNAEKLLAKKPTEMIRIAVKGMLPKNSLGRQMLRKLKIYGGPNHPHEAQMPVPLEI
ncbi:MAG: 50S ribosomal protein L13 [Deltaproteobacteria bacterium CG_4_8_14_3_um_filter_45_9]|nr:MAG: 50S ribosomal protein L13 [Deltaproteobacteria bacterium CG03_land_8_20_14_0_80_45_14]PIX23265.1 MAG: 50S ribosomal protein L13 [Deltaproteobacteria bacterium CG_4_8_14_3_um_filter_45_9]